MLIQDTLTPLSQLPKQPIRLGLQGPPGTGKTWAALTFPNPIIWNLDNKLTGYQAEHPESNILVVNPTRELISNKLGISNRCSKKLPDDPMQPVNIRDGFVKWLDTFGYALTIKDTLIIDSWSALMNWFEIQSTLPLEIVYTKNGEEDGFKYWGRLKKYCIDVTEKLKVLPCNVVAICHETMERDDQDRLTGKLKPLMQGSFKDQLAGQFTDFYRQIPIPEIGKDGKEISINGQKIKGVEYFWQTQSDNIFNACISIPGLPKYVKADYNSLVKKP